MRETELGERLDPRLSLRDKVRARDADVDDAVLDVFGDVARPNEQKIDGGVVARYEERALGRLEAQPGVCAESQRRLRHPALGGHSQAF